MGRAHILAVDQGTTNTKALLLDAGGRVVSRAAAPVDIAFPAPGWVEQDGAHIWRTVEAAIAACLAAAPAEAAASIVAVAIANQRESVLAWDRATGLPAGPCIVWQCRRTAPFCASLRERQLDALIRRKTGLPIDPLFSASKARWLLEQIPDGARRAADGELCLGTIDSWLLWNFTGGHQAGNAVHACDRSNASRTQLLNLHTGAWDPELLDLFGIPAAALPEILPSSSIAGTTARAIGALPAGVPIASLIGDSHAALFGHGAFGPGPVKATYGTGSSLMTLVPAPIEAVSGLATTVAWSLPGETRYALEGNITMTGAAVDWLGQFLGLPSAARDVAALAASVPDSGGVFLVPAFAGLGAPYWDDAARGLIYGMTQATTRAHVARAAVDAIAWQIRDVVEAMRVEGVAPRELLADGGASGNDALMQFQADVLGCPVIRTRSADLSACGAAWLAGLAVGLWPDLAALEALPRETDRFEPRMPASLRDALTDGWRDAVSRTRASGGGGAAGTSARPVASSVHGTKR
jgi:glycerol kinase